MLSHRHNMGDMRSAYADEQANVRIRFAGSKAERPTAPEASRSPHSVPASASTSPTKRAPVVHNDKDRRDQDDSERFFYGQSLQESPRSSIASTVQSEEELAEDAPDFTVPETMSPIREYGAIAATPTEFSELFPSRRRLLVRHDDSTIDGNMNLRIDTSMQMRGQSCDMTLFHLRMHDLKTRDFSLRRYCRDSGREVCHSSAKQRKSLPGARPSLQRSLSNALHSMLPKSEQRRSMGRSATSLTRHDSGYGSMHSMDFEEDDRPRSAGRDTPLHEPSSVDSIYLEFSNYAQVTVKSSGSGKKRHEFEYWGERYSWKRVLLKDRESGKVSFQLSKAGDERILAHIVPLALTPRHATEEQDKGGWISPCSMWIADESIIRSQKDLSDVIVAAGLIALVDTSIRDRFNSATAKSILIPTKESGINYLGPKRLVDDMFGQKGNQDRT